MPLKYKLLTIFTTFLLIYSGCAFVYAQNTERNTVINKIEIKGNERISAAAIKSAVVTMEGDIYSSETISKDVDAIWSLGFFDSIEVEIEQFENGVNVIFVVYERPVVKRIVFEGNNKISEKKLRETVTLLENDDLKNYLVKLDEDKIKALYHKKGFLFVDIKVEEKKSSGGVELIYHINEGEKVRIDKIEFKGNHSLDNKKLSKLMKTSPKRFPVFLFGGIFNKEEFEADIENVKDFYRQKGWLDAEVNWKIDYSSNKTLIYITVNVEEEERYFVDVINVNGQTIFTKNELTRNLHLVEGGPFLLELLDKDIFDLRLLYGEQGFSNVNIDEKHYFNPNDTNVNIVYNIHENERVFIEKIKITGNDKTKDNVIRRQLTFFPGEHLNISKVKDSQQRLINTGYFDRESGAPASVTFEPGSKPNTQNVLLDVKEGRSGMLRFGGGFGANVGLFGDISYTDRNFDILDLPKDLNDLLSGNAFRGGGHVFNIRLAPGIERQEASISIFNPSVYDSQYSAGTSLFSFGRNREDYDEKRKGVNINTGTVLKSGIFLGVTPGFEVISIDDIDDVEGDMAPQDVFDVEGDHAKLGVEFKASINRRDNPFLPAKGYIAETSLEVAGLDVDIIKFIASGRKFQTVYNSPKRGKHIITYLGTLGLVETTSGEDVPIFERFFAGGTGSIRGFRFRGASPVEDAQQVGGDVLLLGSVEYNFPVFKEFLRGVTFVDAGKADKDIADLNFENFRAAAGFGVRFTLPILGRATISLDWAFPIVQQDEDELQIFSFNVGQSG